MIPYKLTAGHCYKITSSADEIIKTKLRITTKYLFQRTNENKYCNDECYYIRV